MGFRLRYLGHDLELPIGEFAIGRAAECQLAIDDPLASRRHALLRVRKDGVTAEDLGSRNGVQVNGTRIEGSRELVPGDRIRIGSQDLTFYRTDDAGPVGMSESDRRRAMQTIAGIMDEPTSAEPSAADDDIEPVPVEPQGDSSATAKRFQSARLLGGVADKALQLGRAEEAERILSSLLLGTLQRAKAGEAIRPAVAEYVALYAARLGGATTKGGWVDFIVELYAILRKPMAASVVDELYTVVRRVKNVDIRAFRTYLADLQQVASELSPTERFLVQRIEGLERLVALA